MTEHASRTPIHFALAWCSDHVTRRRGRSGSRGYRSASTNSSPGSAGVSPPIPRSDPVSVEGDGARVQWAGPIPPVRRVIACGCERRPTGRRAFWVSLVSFPPSSGETCDIANITIISPQAASAMIAATITQSPCLRARLFQRRQSRQCARQDSNLRPRAPEARALSPELRARGAESLDGRIVSAPC
jgi:hypothetical protein